MLSRTIRHSPWKKSQRNAGKNLSSFLESSPSALWISSHPKPSIPAFDDEHSSNFFDYAAPIHLTAMQQQQREEQLKKNLPPVRGPKMSVLLLLLFLVVSDYFFLIQTSTSACAQIWFSRNRNELSGSINWIIAWWKCLEIASTPYLYAPDGKFFVWVNSSAMTIATVHYSVIMIIPPFLIITEGEVLS